MKKALIVLAIVLVVGALAAVAGVAYAQTQTPNNPPGRWSDEFGPGMMGGYGGMMGGYGGMMGGRGGYGPIHDYMEQAVADKLGVSEADIEARLDGGETLYDILLASGVAEADLPQVMTDLHNAALDKAVADGAITQAQADAMKNHMQQRLDGGFGPGNCPMHQGGYGGMMGRGGRGWRFQQQQPQVNPEG
jgi:hypothetical protein